MNVRREIVPQCVQALRAWKTRSVPLGHEDHSSSQGSSSSAPQAPRVISGGETHVCQPSERERKVARGANDDTVRKRRHRTPNKRQHFVGEELSLEAPPTQ